MSTRKVCIITGADNTGKTRCIKEIAKRLEGKNYKYNNLLYTKTGSSTLNHNTNAPITNDDIFGYFVGSFDTIGILSAGDGNGKDEITKCLNLLDEFQPDIIICAAREYPGNSDIQTDIKNQYPKAQPIPISMNKLDSFSTPKEKEEEVDRIFSEVITAIRGF